ncbi:PASTA domain-containing protein [Bifidobacterium saguinibicoloris]|uniref:PASTA domain-containing protein n=1 Tax=Bifidobacterium saguinibicoloris TaxID=2834433 RepID=UPI001C569A16|nr:PASTA domain-containing protein [Bifidobacterium saguinibicoloris]
MDEVNTDGESDKTSGDTSDGDGTTGSRDIYIGVATEGTGVGADIIGEDVDTARSTLRAQGFDVTIKQRFSSKRYIGKVAGTSPTPGSAVSKGGRVVLYEGVGADQVHEVFSYDSPETGGYEMTGSSAVVAGTWCRNDGDCITLDGREAELGPGDVLYQQGRDGVDYGEYGSLTACTNMGDPYCEDDAFLLKQDVGAFEEMPFESLTNYWCNGVRQEGYDESPCSGKAEYRMQDFFLVVPVGSKLDELESNGYFDAGALKTAKQKKKVDTDRPFLLYRNPKLYDNTTATRSDVEAPNPFVPFNVWSYTKNDMVKFKPAPSDADAYYLVESEGDYDWPSLPDADVNGTTGRTSTGASDKSGESSGTKTDATLFKNIAGSYTFYSSGDGSSITFMTVNKDGTFTGEDRVIDGNSDLPVATAPRISYPFHGRFSSITKNDAGGYDMPCDVKAFGFDKPDENQWDSGPSPCGTWHWYPAGTPFSSMNTKASVTESLAIANGRVTSDSWQSALLVNDGYEYGVFSKDQ